MSIKRSRGRKKDPFAARESKRYSDPIASREFISELLTDARSPLSFEAIADELGLRKDAALEALNRRLRAMCRDGQLVQTRRGDFGLVAKMDLVRGRVIGHRDGFGFLVADSGGDDVYLGSRTMRSLMHGDRVVVRITGEDRRGRRAGSLVEVLERNTEQVVGRFFTESGMAFVVPEDRRIHHEVLIPQDAVGTAAHGDIVIAVLTAQPDKRNPPVGRISTVLGAHMAPGMEIDIAVHAHNLPVDFPATVQREVEPLGTEVAEKAKKGRKDYRHLPLVTIDGEDARDFDDAVYCEVGANSYRLVVAIADVAAYVNPGTALDEEAERRGTSVYFPERVIPMLPEVLSNGLCSINPHADRLCMVCEMTISRKGKITRSGFHEGVMRSAARLTYEQVAAVVVERKKNTRRELGDLCSHLDDLYGLFKVLHAARGKRGALDFDTQETRIVFGPDRKIEAIEPVYRNDAHRLIEECMVAANVAAARFLKRHRMPALYRVHQGPSAEKLASLRQFLGELGLTLQGRSKPSALDYAAILDQIRARPDVHLIQTVLLRSLSQAQYHPENTGHFGLALAEYAHFTSPIRRYPDLLVHRAIKHVLHGLPKSEFMYSHEDVLRLGEHTSSTERRADEATRDAIDWLKCEYMLDKVGQTFAATVSAVTPFGLFAELDEIYVEGLVHVTALGNDYFHFDPVHHQMLGERTGQRYRLADRIKVTVVRVDLDERKIDFELSRKKNAKKGRRRNRD